jgi:hypothetical protein
VSATQYNNEYFMANRKGVRNGGAKILNVLQGSNHSEAEHWYQLMKKYCDPAVYPENHFNGWGMGGQNMCSVSLILKRLVSLMDDRLLEEGVHDWMHFLGTSKLEWAVLLTVIQRAVRKYHNPSFTISFDCASPFLATANGQVYTNNEFPEKGKWTYRMNPSVDDKKYAKDSRNFREALLQEGIFEKFDPSPVSDRLTLGDICYYGPTDTNKLGKVGKTSWDSFTYALLMAHNVHRHIAAVQEANERFDRGEYPGMLLSEKFSRISFEQVVDELFSVFKNYGKDAAYEVIEHYSKFFMGIIGTRGFSGKKEVNAHTHFNALFEVVEENYEKFENEEDTTQLDNLEETVS